jgi:hypothetical protein
LVPVIDGRLTIYLCDIIGDKVDAHGRHRAHVIEVAIPFPLPLLRKERVAEYTQFQGRIWQIYASAYNLGECHPETALRPEERAGRPEKERGTGF